VSISTIHNKDPTICGMRKVPDTEKRRDLLNWNESIKLVKAFDYAEITIEKVSDCSRCVFDYLSSLEFSNDECVKASDLAGKLASKYIGTLEVFEIGRTIMSIFDDSQIKSAETIRASLGRWHLAEESFA
jgi:hypothetical protein